MSKKKEKKEKNKFIAKGKNQKTFNRLRQKLGIGPLDLTKQSVFYKKTKKEISVSKYPFLIEKHTRSAVYINENGQSFELKEKTESNPYLKNIRYSWKIKRITTLILILIGAACWFLFKNPDVTSKKEVTGDMITQILDN